MERLVNWINKLGYNGYNLTAESLKEAVKLGMRSEEYTCLISWLSHEIQNIEKYESYINPVKDVNDQTAFLVELSTFLREVDCPYLAETLDFSNSSDFEQKEWLLILDFLIGELAFAKLNQARQGETQELEIKMPESDIAKGLRESLQTLSVSKPPPNVTGVQLFSKIDSRVKEIMAKYPQLSKEPLFSGTLTEKQWDALECLLKELAEEYACRKEVLLQRLDVTMQSFKWGETGKKRSQDIEKVYQQHLAALPKKQSGSIANILAAREDILEEEKTSGATVREGTKSSLNQVIIGSVPDRGGRPEDQKPPPPEVPSWKTGPKPANPPPGSSGGYNQQSNRGPGSSFGGHSQTGSRYKDSDDHRSSNYGNRGYESAQGQRGQNSFDNMSNENMSSGRNVSNVYRNERGGGSDRYSGRGSHDYDNSVNRGTGSLNLDNGSFGQYGSRSFVPGETFQPYGDSHPAMCNPPSHNMGHMEGAYLSGYSQPAFRPMYQPAMGFGGYGGPVPGGGIGGYGASGGNYEQNAPYVQSYQAGGRGHSQGRQPRGGRGPRRGGRSRNY